MELIAAEICDCAGGGWSMSPMLLVLISGVLLAGSVVAALRFRRRASRHAAPVAGDAPRVARVGLVTVTLPPPLKLHGGTEPEGTGAVACRGDT